MAILILAVFLSLNSPVFAQEDAAPVPDFKKATIPAIESVGNPSGSALEQSNAPSPSLAPPSKDLKKPRVRAERDTEGTKAPHQIEGDPVLKSYYKSETGEPLEVDPD